MSSCSLFELNEYIRRVLALNFPEACWVRCEISQVKAVKGNYYLDVLEKGPNSVIAQAQAILWSREFNRLQKKLGENLKAILQEGLEVQFLAKVDFTERFGLKLIIEDFEPAYSLGKLELKRQETIQQLKALDLLDKNKRNYLLPVLQRLAVLTSETAAGYQDFKTHLEANPYGYQFDCQLFSTSVQGQQAEVEMLAQLERIARKPTKFDAVVIIRGGGAKLDLAVFDHFGLCKAIAQLPLPVLTGIGHEVDETVADLVSFQSLKTPTAVADFVINLNHVFENEMFNLALALQQTAVSKAKGAEIQLQYAWSAMVANAKGKLRQHQLMLDYIAKEMPGTVKYLLERKANQLETMEQFCRLLSPEVALKRGFSITMLEGKPVVSVQQLTPGDEIETHFHDGSTISTIKTKRQ